MAIETEVDKLVLGIEVNDKTDGESASKKISSLTKSLNGLQEAVTNFDTTNLNKKFSSMATSIKPFISQLKEAEKSITALSNVMKMSGGNGLSKVLDSSTMKNLVAKPTEQKILSDETPKAPKDESESLDDESETMSKGTSKLALFVQFLKKIKSGQKDVNKESTKASNGGLKRFFNSIKRIAMYRLIRSFLKDIAQGLRDGINNLAGYSSEFNTTMSNITSQITILKNSVGLIGSSLVEAIDPVITSFTQAFGNFANAISYTIAKLKGESTYLKVNLDYWKEYNKQANLLSFDSFSTLTKNDTSDMYETVSIDDEESTESFSGLTDTAEILVNLVTSLVNILKSAWTVLRNIASTDAFQKLCDWVKQGVSWLADFLSTEEGVKTALVILGGILVLLVAYQLLLILTNPFTGYLIAIAAVIAIVAVLVKYWDVFVAKLKKIGQVFVDAWNEIKSIFVAIGDWFQSIWNWIVNCVNMIKTVVTTAWQTIKNMFKSVATTVITWFTNIITKVKSIFTKIGNALSAFFSNIGIAIANVFIGIVNWIIKCINAILTPINKVANIFGKSVQISSIEYLSFKAFAEGGFPDTGQLFVARESGAEMVGSMNGHTAVANNDQIVTGIQQGVYNAMMSVLSQNKSNGEMYVYIDGTKAGRVVESAVFNEGVRVGHFKRK